MDDKLALDGDAVAARRAEHRART
ncbi:MAG: hypothetical protein JWO25_2511, partial [Alphaproteobacteria bacterium]|nr:hypothetical protein [Alphaproteobacteria bacterium]